MDKHLRPPRIVVLLAFCLLAGRLAASDNLIANDGFETDELGYLGMWSMEAYQYDADSVRFFATTEQKHSGARAFAIANLKPNDARALQWVRVKPDTFYRLSCWMMAGGVGSDGMGANISVLGSTSAAGDLRDTGGRWELVELVGRTGPEQQSLAVMVRLGFYGSLATGIAVFDDVKLEEMAGPPAGSTEAVISFSSNKAGGTLPVVRGAVASQLPRGSISRGLFFTTLAALLVALAGLVAALWRSAAWRQLTLRGGSGVARRALVAADGSTGLAAIGGSRAAGLDRQRMRGKPALQAPRTIEHRSSLRRNVPTVVSVHKTSRDGGVSVLRLLSQDISDGGIFVLSDDMSILELDQEVAIEASQGKKSVSLGKAIVMRAQERYDKKGKPAGCGFGLMFEDFGLKMAKVRRSLVGSPAR